MKEKFVSGERQFARDSHAPNCSSVLRKLRLAIPDALVDLNDVTFQVEILEPEAGELAWAHAGFRSYPFKKVVLVGHSAGATAVRSYQAQTQDTRVVGVVLASGIVRSDTRVPDPELLAQAKRMIADGRPEDPFVSAATFVDIVNTPPEFKDFFGIQTPNPGVTRIHCPLLAFFGTNGDVGGEEELELLKSSIKRQQSGPSSVNTVMIHGADHMYAGQQDQVADVIASWASALSPCRPDLLGHPTRSAASQQKQ